MIFDNTSESLSRKLNRTNLSDFLLRDKTIRLTPTPIQHTKYTHTHKESASARNSRQWDAKYLIYVGSSAQ